MVNIRAQLDTAADRTVIPTLMVAPLGLVEIRKTAVAGIGGQVQFWPLYVVAVEIRHLQSLTATVLSADNEPFVLLGRDILNHFRILLDGPQLAFEIG